MQNNQLNKSIRDRISKLEAEKMAIMCAWPKTVVFSGLMCFSAGLGVSLANLFFYQIGYDTMMNFTIGATAFGVAFGFALVGYDLNKTNKELKILEAEKEMVR